MITRPEARLPLRVAWVITSDLRPYRIPLLSRLATRSDLTVDVFHGPAKPNSGAPSIKPQTASIPLSVTELRAIRWPFGRRQIAWLSGMARLLAADYDVLMCQETVNNVSVWMFALLHRLFGKRLVLHGWGYRSQATEASWTTSLRRNARRFLLRRADAVLVYTDRGKAGCIELGLPAERIFVSRNTLDVERLREIGREVPQSELDELRENLGSEDHLRLLFVGRLQATKRVDILIETVEVLRAAGHPCSLIVIGDGPERAALEKRADGLGGMFFTGAVYDERSLAPYFLLADLLVVPGRIGLTCVHAFSYGLPVFTASDDVMPQTPEYEYVIHDVNGAIINELSANAFADAIDEAISVRSRLESLREGARLSADDLRMEQMAAGFVRASYYAASRKR